MRNVQKPYIQMFVELVILSDCHLALYLHVSYCVHLFDYSTDFK